MKFGERMATVESDVKHIKEKLDDFIESADKKFASKLTERMVYGLVALILVAFITNLTGLW